MSSNKQFPATAKKLNKAREEGDIAKSRTLTAVLTTIVGTVWILSRFCNYGMLVSFAEICFGGGRDFGQNKVLLLNKGFGVVLTFCLPFLLLQFVSTVVVELMQVGPVFSFKLLAFKVSRLNFFANFKRMFLFVNEEDSQGRFGVLTEISKVVVIFFVFCLVSLFIGFLSIRNLLNNTFSDISVLILVSKAEISQLMKALLSSALIIGGLEFICKKIVYIKRLKMDREEFRKEMRESEGDPEIRGLRKQLHQEVNSYNVIQGVRKAKVVLVNRGELIR